MVPVVSLRQNVPSYIQQLYVVHGIHRVFSSAGVSIIGPLLFVVYTADLKDIAEKHGVSIHTFADDTQLYLHCRCKGVMLKSSTVH